MKENHNFQNENHENEYPQNRYDNDVSFNRPTSYWRYDSVLDDPKTPEEKPEYDPYPQEEETENPYRIDGGEYFGAENSAPAVNSDSDMKFYPAGSTGIAGETGFNAYGETTGYVGAIGENRGYDLEFANEFDEEFDEGYSNELPMAPFVAMSSPYTTAPIYGAFATQAITDNTEQYEDGRAPMPSEQDIEESRNWIQENEK